MHLRKYHLLHNLHAMEEDLHRGNREKIGVPLSRKRADAFKPVARYFNLHNHSHHNMTICWLSLHHRNTESRKNLEKKFISTGYTLISRDQWTLHIRLIFSQIRVTIFPPMAKFLHTPIQTYNTPQFLYSLWRRANARNASFLNFSWCQFSLHKIVW